MPARSESDALGLLFEGETNRAIASHLLNQSSTRSHCVFTIHLETTWQLPGGEERVTRSKLNLVDLPGSERVEKTGSSGHAPGGSTTRFEGALTPPKQH